MVVRLKELSKGFTTAYSEGDNLEFELQQVHALLEQKYIFFKRK